MRASSAGFAAYQRALQGTPSPDEQRTTRATRTVDDHLDAIRAKLSAAELEAFERGVARMRKTRGPGGLGQIEALSVDDVVEHLRREMRNSPLIHRDGDAA